jgi:hypothetical protein
MTTDLFRLSNTLPRDPNIDAWLHQQSGELGIVARHWFEVMRQCGDDVRELYHGGCPTACLGDVPFAYVNVFASHTNVGFFQGASLPDPGHLLQGTSALARYVKLKPRTQVDAAALHRLIHAAYADIKSRIENA